MITDLVYDVGMNNGDDTAHYLHKGYRVVAIEADPTLIDAARERFADAIRSGRLQLVNAGVGPRDEVADFWICDEKREWNSPYQVGRQLSGLLHRMTPGNGNGHAGNGEGWEFPFGSSGPFDEETAGTWQTLDQVAFTWTAYQLGHSHYGQPGLNVWHDVHARLSPDVPEVHA